MNEYCITLMTESVINLTIFSETADSARKELNDLIRDREGILHNRWIDIDEINIIKYQFDSIEKL